MSYKAITPCLFCQLRCVRSRGEHADTIPPCLPQPEPCGRVTIPSPVWLAEGMRVKKGIAPTLTPCLLSLFHTPPAPETSITPEPERLRHSIFWLHSPPPQVHNSAWVRCSDNTSLSQASTEATSTQHLLSAPSTECRLCQEPPHPHHHFSRKAFTAGPYTTPFTILEARQ